MSGDLTSLARRMLVRVVFLLLLGAPMIVAATNVKFVGNVGYSYVGGVAVLTANRVENFDVGGFSGTLHMELWAFSTPYVGSASFGYKLAQHSLGQLNGGYYLYNISSGAVPFGLPPNGTWYLVMLLTEYTGSFLNGGYDTRHWVNFTAPLLVGPVSTPPSTPLIRSATAGNNSISVAFTAGAQGTGFLLSHEAECSSATSTRSALGAVSPIVVSGLTNGVPYNCRVRTNTTDGTSNWSAYITNVVPSQPAVAANYTDMWWAGPAENGWGMSIQQHGNVQFNALYIYDIFGKPVWYVMPGGTWSNNFTVFSGPIYQPSSAPLNGYTPTQFVVGASPGTVSLTFTSNSTAILQYTINGISGQKSIQRQEFGSGAAPLSVGDMWWGGTTQDGWGLSIVQRSGILFGAWYTYGPDGKASWYVLPTGTWSGSTYSGPFYSTTGSGWLGTTYNANQLAVTQAGNMTLTFNNANSAVMSYSFTSGPFAGTTQSKQISRMSY